MSTILGSVSSEQATDRIEQFIGEMVAAFQPEDPQAPGRRGRARIVPALCLWTGVLICVLRGMRQQRALWRLLTQGSLWFYPRFAVTDDAIYKRLERDGTAPLEHLLEQVTQVLRERLAPYARQTLAPFATAVFALDETTLDHLARRLPVLRGLPSDDPRLLGGTVTGLFDIRRQLWHRVRYRTDWQQNEKVLARAMIADLPTGCLILADLGYFGFPWFDDLTDADQFWISRVRSKTSYEVIHTSYRWGDTFDGIVWLGAYRADRAKHAVRLITFRVGQTLYRYLTNVLDPRMLTPRMVAELYARRWDFELAVNTGKTHLGLHVLWSSKAVVIEQQVLAVVIIAQILQALRLEIAGRSHVDPFEVSLPLMIQYLPQLAARGLEPVDAFLRNAREVGFIRPSSRTCIQAPEIPPAKLVPLPAGTVLERTPRYAQRNCGPRHDRATPRRILSE
jgi:Transposase DDE domain